VVESHDDFPGVEISIAGGVGEMVRVHKHANFFFFFLISIINCFYRANVHLCSSHGPRYNGLSAKRGPGSPKPPTTVHPAIPKLKPSDPARQRKNPARYYG